MHKSGDATPISQPDEISTSSVAQDDSISDNSAIHQKHSEKSPLRPKRTKQSKKKADKKKLSEAQDDHLTLIEEQYLENKKQEADAAKVLLNEGFTDRVELFDYFVPATAMQMSIVFADKLVFDYEEQLIQKQQHSLVLIWRKVIHPERDSPVSIKYYGDPLCVVINRLGELSGHLMVPFHLVDAAGCRHEMLSAINRIIDLDKLPDSKNLWKRLMSKTLSVIKKSGATNPFWKYLSAVSIAYEEKLDCTVHCAFKITETVLDSFRRFLFSAWRLMVRQMLFRLKDFITTSDVGNIVKIPILLKRKLPYLWERFQSIEDHINDMLHRSGMISANDVESFMCRDNDNGMIQDFEIELFRLEAVLSIGQQISQWREQGNHGVVAISAGTIICESWEIDIMLQESGYAGKDITRDRVHHERRKRFYTKRFAPLIPIPTECISTINNCSLEEMTLESGEIEKDNRGADVGSDVDSNDKSDSAAAISDTIVRGESETKDERVKLQLIQDIEPLQILLSNGNDDLETEDLAVQEDQAESMTIKNRVISPTKAKKASQKVVSEEQLLRDKKREADVAKALLKRKEPKDKVAIFDLFPLDSESLAVGDQMIFDFEEHLINKKEYSLVLVGKRIIHSKTHQTNTGTVAYYGDPRGVLIAGMASMSGYLMIPFEMDSKALMIDTLSTLIQKTMSLDKVPALDDMWKTLMTETRSALSPLIQDNSRSAAHRFLKCITAATVAYHRGDQHHMILMVDDRMLDILRRFMLVMWREVHKQFMYRLQSLLNESKLSKDGKVPAKLRGMLPALWEEFKSIQETMDIVLTPEGTVSAQQFHSFLMTAVSVFDAKLARLDCVLSIANSIHLWRGKKNHGIIAVSVGAVIGDSWAIDQMLYLLGYGNDCLSRERVHHDRARGYYYKPYTPVPIITVADPMSTLTLSSKSKRKKKGKGNRTTTTL